MPTATFTYTVSGNYTVASTTSALSFTLTGNAVPSGATITSANFSASRVNHYSVMRQFIVRSGGVDLFDWKYGFASDGSSVAINFPITGLVSYGSSTLSISFAGRRGSASVDGDIISIRDGCVLQITVNYQEETPIGNPPSAPTINAPVAGTTIYNARPRVLMTVGSDPNNLSQTISLFGYSPSRTGNLSPGTKIIMMRAAALTAGGVQSVSATATNTDGYTSTAETRSFTYSIPVFTTVNLTVNETPVRAVDINELRAMVLNITAYYGLQAPNFGSSLVAQQSPLSQWSTHILDIRAAIDAIVSHVNGWDTVGTSNKITPPTWLTIPENRPRVDVMNQLRSVIATL